MPCPTCGADTAPKSMYCSQCGARLDPSRPEAAPPPAPQAAVSAGAGERIARTVESRRGRTDVPDETIWEGGFSTRAMIPAFVTAGVVSLIILAVALIFPPAIWIALAIPVIWIYVIGLLIYRKLAVTYRLTTFRFFHETGILRRTIDRVEVIDMDDISVVQGVIDRMLNVGQIRVSSTDRSHPVLILRGIDQVRDVAAKIDQIRRAERTRRGLHIEMI